MPNESADAFLDCIMGRSKYDTLIHMGTVFLVVAVAPVIIAYFVYSGNITGNDAAMAVIGSQLLEDLVFNFIIFSIVLALYNHHRRDLIWMDALIGYAESYGHDVSGLKEIRRRSSDDRIASVVRIFRIYIVALTAVVVIHGAFISAKGIDIGTCRTLVALYLILMVVLLCISTGYQFRKLRVYDKLQRRFEKEFCSMMSRELNRITPNAGRIWTRHVWPHVILMVITLGLYSFPFSLYIVHTMNVHITTQHRFEGRLMRAIMEKEGATGIRRIETDRGKGIGSMVLNFFR